MKNKSFRKRRELVLVVLILITLISASMASGVWARFLTESDGESEARVASFAFSAYDESTENFRMELPAIKHPGTNQDFVFTVSNQSGNAKSEVAQRIYAAVEVEGGLPLTITIKDVNGGLIDFESAELTTFACGDDVPKTFVLTVTWPADQNNVSLMDKKTTVTLSLTAEQID